MKPHITVERLRELFSYDPETGIVTRLIDRSGRGRHGQTCGTMDSHGRLQAIADGRLLMVHCIAWALMTGEWPLVDVDHRNLIRHENRWDNLRLATRSQNCANSRGKKTRKLASKGVTQVRGRFLATITQNYKRIHIGYFGTEAEAADAYNAKAMEINGEFAIL